MTKSAQRLIPARKFSMPMGGLTALGVSLAASLTALIAATPELQAGGGSGRIVTAQAASEPGSAYQGTPPPGYGGAMGAVQDWLARANRDYQGVVIKGLSVPQAGDAAADEIARKIEETRREAARAAAVPSPDADKQAADAKAREEAEKAAAAAKAQADAEAAAEAQRRDAEEKAEAARKSAEAQAKADAELQAKAAAAAKAAQEAAAKAEAQRLANEREEQAQRAAESRRAADAEAKRLADEQRKAEARIADENRRRADAVAPPAPAAASAPPPEPERDTPAVEDRRAVVVTTEPIRRPAPVAEKNASPSPRYASTARYDRDRPGRRWRHGARVKRWMHRRHSSRVCRAAGRRIHPPGRYTVARGDSLWRISARHYRAGRLYKKIYRANRRIIRVPRLIYPCQRFYVPRWR